VLLSKALQLRQQPGSWWLRLGLKGKAGRWMLRVRRQRLQLLGRLL
jgi:hypothetical protein